jgi:2-keto-4-pentenoate hydratase/2-oxohepta-3-ene-1,7-dioic acid hydratase in catechol pathway
LHYYHQIDGLKSTLPVGKVVCVGRNYAAHAQELNNPIPNEPVLFLKPATALVHLTESIVIPRELGSCHFETELAILISQPLRQGSTEQQAEQAIAGVGLALDLTLRDLQQRLKESGLPWEKAKAFDGACPLSEFIAIDQVENIQDLSLSLWQNGELRQQGHTGQMLVPVLALLTYATQFFSLQPGDVFLTGTPAGVGALKSGDRLKLCLSQLISATTTVA